MNEIGRRKVGKMQMAMVAADELGASNCWPKLTLAAGLFALATKVRAASGSLLASLALSLAHLAASSSLETCAYSIWPAT